MQLLLDKSHYNSSRAVSNILFIFLVVIGAKQWVKQTIRIQLNSKA